MQVRTDIRQLRSSGEADQERAPLSEVPLALTGADFDGWFFSKTPSQPYTSIGLTMAAATLAADRAPIDERAVGEARDTPSSTLIPRAADSTKAALSTEPQEVLLRTLRSIASEGEVTIGRIREELTSTVAAHLLGISHPPLMKLARNGEIDSFTMGGHPRFRRDEVLRA